MDARVIAEIMGERTYRREFQGTDHAAFRKGEGDSIGRTFLKPDFLLIGSFK